MMRSAFPAFSLLVLIAGCTGVGARPAGDIRARAEEVARQRLATAALARSSHGDAMLHECRSPDPAATSAGRKMAVAAIPFTRRVADGPTDTAPAENSLAPSESDQATIERGPLPRFRTTLKRDLKELPKVLWEDTKSVYTNPYNLIFLLGAGGASAALRPEVDDDIEDYYDDHHSLKEDWRDAFGAIGNPITHFAMAGAWYLAGQQFQDAKTYEVGKRAISALTVTGVSTMLLKVAANTDSPNGESLAWPSGHVSSSMAMATVLNNAYGPLVGVPMFGLTGLVALERLDDGEHHFSDVVFGAALGWVVAETVMKEHRPEIFGGEIVPYVDPNGRAAGLAWVKSLGN